MRFSIGLNKNVNKAHASVRISKFKVQSFCFKVQALAIFEKIYQNHIDISPFCASNGWFENYLKRKCLVLRRITAKGRDLPKNFRAISLEYFSRNKID